MDKKKLGHEWISRGLGEDGRERFDINITSKHDLISQAKKSTVRMEMQSQRNTVWTADGRVPINEEYLAANQALKDYRKKITEYSGSKEIASDMLFEKVKQDGIEGVKKSLETFKALKSEESDETITNEKVRFCQVCWPKCAGHRDFDVKEGTGIINWFKKWIK